MTSIAVFKWTGRLPSDDELGADPANRYSKDYGEQWAYQACHPVAVAVLEAVRQLGHTTDVGTPYYGENGWHFIVHLSQQDYSIMVLWIPRGNRIDYFAVIPSVRRGCIASLFVAQPTESSLRPIRETLETALTKHPQVADMEWVDEI